MRGFTVLEAQGGTQHMHIRGGKSDIFGSESERQNAFGRSDNDRRKFWISTNSQEIHYL